MLYEVITLISNPDQPVKHLSIPAKFMNPEELRQYYLEQRDDLYYEKIVNERLYLDI